MNRSPLLSALTSAGFAVLGLAACEFGGGDDQGEPGKKVPASLTWMSTTLAKAGTTAKVAAPATPTVDSGDFYLSYRLTPSNMEGRLIRVGLMVGQAGPAGASRLGLAGPENFMDASVANAEDHIQFNMSDRLTMGEGFQCCWSTYPSDDMAYSAWFEVMFAYVDASFSVHAGALAGNHTVRAAFADIGNLGYKRGDLLYKTDAGFRWVDSASGELAAVRPAKPLRLGWVAEYAGSGDGRGNQHIPVLFIPVQDSQKVHMPADTVLANSWEFVTDFILTNGLIFRRQDPAAMTRVSELLKAFDIRADRDNASGGADGISSNFYAIRTPLAEPRPNDFKDSLGNWILPPPADSADEDP